MRMLLNLLHLHLLLHHHIHKNLSLLHHRGIIDDVDVNEDVTLEEVDAEKDAKVAKDAAVQGRLEDLLVNLFSLMLCGSSFRFLCIQLYLAIFYPYGTKISSLISAFASLLFLSRKLEEKRIEEEQAVTAQNRKLPVCYDDDNDEEESNSLKDNNIFELPPCSAVTPNEPSLHNEDFSEKIFSNPLFEEEIISIKKNQHHFNAESDLVESMLNHDSSIISSSSKIDSLLDEFAGELTFLKSIPPGVDKTDCHPKNDIRLSQRLLYDNSSPRPPEEFNSENSNDKIESFSPSPIPNKDSDYFMEEIDLFLNLDDPMPPSIEDDEDSEGDILFLERLLHDDLIPLSDIPDFSYEVRTFLPFFTYLVTFPVLLSSGSENKIFDPGITVNHFYSFQPGSSHRHGTFMKFNTHRSHLNEWPMIINGKNTPLLDIFILWNDRYFTCILQFFFKNSNAEIESFSPSPIPIEDSDSRMEEIDLSFNSDDPMPPGIDEDDYDSERDILIREELLDNYSLSLPVIESYHFDIPSFSRPPAKPPGGNTGILNIRMMGDISEQKVPIPRLMITLVSNQEKSPDLLSHRSLEIFYLSAKRRMMIHGKNIPILDVPLFQFYPLDQFTYRGNWVKLSDLKQALRGRHPMLI
nr:hypothetical protein [Tanacetum cinerariifolium]